MRSESGREPPADVHRFAEYELDAARFRLTRAGRPVEVEPRVLELICELAARPGELRTRRELLDLVWAGREVGDAALSRSLYEARRAIGDDAREVPWIRTVHGRGICFEPPPASEPSGEGREGGRRPRRLLALHGRRLVLAAALLLPLLLALAFARVPRSLPESPARPTPEVRLAVIPLAAPPGDRGLELLAFAATDLLEEHLRRRPEVLLRDGSRVEELAATEPSLGEIAARLRVEMLVSGTVEGGPGGPRVELLGHRFPEAGGQRIAAGPVADLADDRALALLAAQAKAWAGELTGSGAGSGPSTEGPETLSLEAYRLTLRAGRSFGLECDSPSGLELLERALALDPGLAAAAVRSARRHLFLASRCGFGVAHWDAAVSLGRQAAGELREGARIAVEALLDAGHLERAWASLEMLEVEDLPLRALRAEVLALAGLEERADRELDEILALDDGLWLDGAQRPPWRLLDGRREDELLELLGPVREPRGRCAAGLAALQRGRVELAREILSPAFGEDPTSLEARFSQALLAELDEAPAEALRILERLELEAASVPLRLRLQMAEQRARLGDRDGTRRAVTELVEVVGCTECFAAALELVGEAPFGRSDLDERGRERRQALASRFGP